nr:hypothetical protein [Tanacetum cinerariifolium]
MTFEVELGLKVLEDEVVPKVDDVYLVDEVFDGSFGRDGEEDFVRGEGVVVSSSSLKSKRKGSFGPNGESGRKFKVGFEENIGSCGGKGKRGGSIVGRGGGDEGGVKNKSLTGSMFMTNGEECLDGWVRAGGGEVNGGEGKVVVRHLESMEELIDNRWVVIEHDKEETKFEG